MRNGFTDRMLAMGYDRCRRPRTPPHTMSRSFAWLETLLADARQAMRAFRNGRGFVATALIALTLGIGANIAVFSVANSVLLKPVPFPEPERLLMLMISANGEPVFPVASPAQFIHWKTNLEAIEDVTAFTSASFNYAGSEAPVRIPGARVSEAYFRAFRAPFIQGRGFTAEEDRPGGGRLAVISHGFWTTYLGANPNSVGSTISLSGDAYTVVGIVGPGFDVGEFGSPEVWTPLQVDPGTTTQGYLYQAAARLKPGVTLAQARNELEALASSYRELFPGVLGPRAGFSAVTLQEALVGTDARSTLLVLGGAVGFVLLIACANVANVLLVRANGRRGDIAVRTALGASRLRIVQQLLTEGLLLSVTGGALGLVVGLFGIRTLLAVDTAGLPRLGEAGALVGLDWRVAAFAVFISIVTGVVFSLMPAIVSSRTNPVEALNDSGGRTGSGIRQDKAQSALVVVEVAVAALLLVGAALLVRTSFALHQVDPGFNSENLLTMQTSMTGPRFATSESVTETVRAVRERLGALPRVVDSVATCCIPMRPGLGLPFNIIGRDNEDLFTGSNAVVFTSPGYFDIFEIPVLSGRGFNDSDDASGPAVAVINEALARRYWPDDADPLRDRMLIGGGAGNLQELAEEPVRQIVGIVGNVRGDGLADDPGPIMYVPQAQIPDAMNALVASVAPMTWVVRTENDPLGWSATISGELRRSTGMPVTELRTMDDVLFLSVARQRLHMLLMSVFSVSALLLAVIGIYAVMAYAVQNRNREIGVRLALGADARQIRRMVIGYGLRLVSLGLVLGLTAAYALASALSSVLFEVSARDPAAFVLVTVILAVVCLTAVLAPAVRAGRVAPSVSIKHL